MQLGSQLSNDKELPRGTTKVIPSSKVRIAYTIAGIDSNEIIRWIHTRLSHLFTNYNR